MPRMVVYASINMNPTDSIWLPECAKPSIISPLMKTSFLQQMGAQPDIHGSVYLPDVIYDVG